MILQQIVKFQWKARRKLNSSGLSYGRQTPVGDTAQLVLRRFANIMISTTVNFVLIYCVWMVILAALGINGLATPEPTIHFRPVRLSLHQVSQSYPNSLARTLFSSTPRRQFAIRNITFEVESELLLLLGDSSSGKSTILRLVSGSEAPVEGTITRTPPLVKPVYLDRKPPLSSSMSVGALLRKQGRMSVPGKVVDSGVAEAVLRELCTAIGMGEAELERKPPQLSPSEVFRFGLVGACLESILPSLVGQTVEDVMQSGVPGPLLLLDEWMDTETSSTTQRVEHTFTQLSSLGAVILCATHRPNHLARGYRSITLCRGNILSTRRYT